MSFEEGAAFPIQTLTAWHMLHTVEKVRPGQTVVVHSAAGGVGIVAVQIAKRRRARGQCSVRLQRRQSGGCQTVRRRRKVINYESQDFSAEKWHAPYQ